MKSTFMLDRNFVKNQRFEKLNKNYIKAAKTSNDNIFMQIANTKFLFHVKRPVFNAIELRKIFFSVLINALYWQNLSQSYFYVRNMSRTMLLNTI